MPHRNGNVDGFKVIIQTSRSMVWDVFVAIIHEARTVKKLVGGEVIYFVVVLDQRVLGYGAELFQ